MMTTVKPIGYQTEQEKRQTFKRVVRKFGPAIHAAQDRISAAELIPHDANLNTPIVKSDALEEAHELSLVKALPGAAGAMLLAWVFFTGFFCL
jgi:hypothetical protein